MKKLFTLLLVCSTLAFSAHAQKAKGTLKGTLQDSVSGTPLNDATVSLVKLQDSSLISFTLTDSKGRFEIANIEPGEYEVQSSYTGLQSLRKKIVISAEKPVVDLGAVYMDRSYKTMEEVVITEAPVRVNGDTIAYKADAFKTKPNATVEDLLKKLPGVQVERDGTVKAQGENVQKVYVDGKEFFSNDPKLATKNLTAEMVDQVEVYDDMSEQAKFNGIDDGSRSKAINLKLKKDKKKGLFGKAYAGAGGPGERWDMGLNANMFKGATQTSVIAKSNNNNNTGFTLSDMIGTMGGGSMMGGMMSGGGGMVANGGGMMGGSGLTMSGGVLGGGTTGGSNSGGITKSSQVGVNYRDLWGEKFSVNGSYFFTHTNTGNQRNFNQKYFSGYPQLREGTSNSRVENDNHRFNFNVIASADSFNSIIYNPNFNYQKTFNTFSNSTYNDFFSKGGDAAYLANKIQSGTQTEGDGYNWANNLIWRKKFRRPGRTFSLSLSGTLGHTERDVISTYNAISYDPTGAKRRDSLANLLNQTEGKTRNYGVSLSYTEPIARDKILEFNYSHFNNNSQSDREVMNFDPLTGKHSIRNDSLSNNYETQNVSDRFGTNLRIVKKKYNYQFGFAVQQTGLQSNNLSKNKLLSQKFTNLFPTASFNYQFARSRSLRFNYRGSTRQPSVSQLQETPDKTNPPNVYIGNPQLQQEFSNNINLSYNFFDMIRFRNLFVFINFSNTMGKIANSITQDSFGVQTTRPVNLDGAYNVTGTFNMGFPIKKMKGGTFNTNTRMGYNRDVNLVNAQKSYTNNLTVGEDLRLSYNYKEKLDVGVGVSTNYTSVSYSNPRDAKRAQAYFTHALSGDITYTLPKGFILSTDFDYTIYSGLSSGYNQNYSLWNAGLAKELFKNKKGELKFSVNDILNQNRGISRNTNTYYVEDVQNLVLQRYFMLTFTYKLNRMGGRAMPSMMERATKGVRFQ